MIAPTFTHAGNSFSGKVRAFFMKLAGFPSPQQVDERGIPDFSAAERLDGAEKRCAESLVPADLCRVCENRRCDMSFFENTRKPVGLWRKNHGCHDESRSQPSGTVGTSLFGAYSGCQSAGLRLRRRGEYQKTAEKMPAGCCQRASTIRPVSVEKSKRVNKAAVAEGTL